MYRANGQRYHENERRNDPMVAQQRPISAADFEQFLLDPENREKHFQLINGEIVEKVVTQQHGIIAVNIASAIKAYLRDHKIGRVAVEVRHRAPDDSANELLPDVSFTRDLDKPVTDVGPVPYMPDLAVEIKSPDDTYKGMREKARYYLVKGTQAVWLIFPEKRLVEVYTTDDEQILNEDDTLTGADVLPDFMLSVKQIFED
jgi:Uma2 family endonuclease